MKRYFRRKFEAWLILLAAKILIDRNVQRAVVVSRRDNNDMWGMAEQRSHRQANQHKLPMNAHFSEVSEPSLGRPSRAGIGSIWMPFAALIQAV